MRHSIRTRLAITFIALAASLLLLVGVVLAWQSYVSEQRQAITLQSERAQRISSQVLAYMQTQENALQQLINVRGLADLDHDQQTQLLSELLSYSESFNTLTLLNSTGQESIIVSRTEINPQPVSRSTADEFTLPMSNNQTYYGPVQFSAKSGEPFLVIAVPMINIRTGKATGVLVADVRFKPVWDLLANTSLGAGSSAYIIDDQSRVIAHNNPSIVLRNTQFAIPAQDGVQAGVAGSSVVLAKNMIRLGEQQFAIVAETPTSQAFAGIVRTELTIALLLVVAIAIAGGLGWLLARQITQPLEELVAIASAITQGDLSKQAEVNRHDEFGNLAEAFNLMTAQLRTLIGALEQRVADRTKALETSTEVSRRLSTILDQKQLVAEVVNQVKKAFNYYHVHIYLLDEASGDLIMAGGTGEAGAAMLARDHKVLRGRGLVGRAAQTNSPVLVPDTSSDPAWLPNPLLPETRSEIAVPIAAGDRVLGVLDVQNDSAGSLGQQDVDLLRAVADQVAIAVQNAALYARAENAIQEAQSLVNYAAEAILVVDLESGNFTEPNESAVKLYGLPREDLVKVGPAQMSPARQPDGRDSTEKAMEKINEAMQGNNTIFEWMHRNAQGQDFLCEIRLVRLPGAHPRVRATVTDITERKRLEDLSRRRAEQQETLNIITQKIQRATTVEAALQIAARELGHALGKETRVQLDTPEQNSSQNN